MGVENSTKGNSKMEDVLVVENSTKIRKLNSLKSLCEKCQECQLGLNRNSKIVFGEGCSNASIMCIGEAPGFTESQTGRPFVGRSGILLRSMLKEACLDLNEDIYIANTIKCRPPDNRTPEVKEIGTCVNFLNKQISIIKPSVLVLLGRTSIKGIFPFIELYTKAPIDYLRGISKESYIKYQGIRVLITYHPSALLYNSSLKIKVQEDFEFLKSLMDNLLISE
jgi:uracil-DNA glycosylase